MPKAFPRLLTILLFLLLFSLACSITPKAAAPKSALELSVSSPTAPLKQGQIFDVTLTVRNIGAYNTRLAEIRLPSDFLACARYEGSVPALSLSLLANGDGQIKLDYPLAPQGEQSFTFRFTAQKPGEFSASGTVVTENGSSVFQLQANIDGIPLSPSQASPASEATPAPLGKIPWQAVVEIKAIVEIDGKDEVGWTGSGTFITPDGLILTSAHVVLSDRFYTVKDLVVALTVAQDQRPVDTYHATIVQADADLDIALLRPSTNMQGVPLLAGSLDLPAVPLGDPTLLNLGDTLTILGYPGIGGETITLTRGVVSGFTADPAFGNRAFIKTNAVIVGGNSGGLVVNEQGELIGVPSMMGSGDAQTSVIDCRTLADTNRDGVIDNQDTCIPTGGFINALRPVDLALPLIEAAKRGEISINAGLPPVQTFIPSGKIIFEDDFSDPSSGWSLTQTESARRGYENGEYTFEVKKDNFVIWSDQPYTLENTQMRVDARVLTPTQNSDFGFVCGIQDEDNFTALEVSEDGYFSIWKQKAGEFITLLDWQYAPQLASDGTLQLSAACSPQGLILAVDDVLLGNIVDPEFTGGTVGLLAGTYENAGFKVAFDNFKLMIP